VLTLPALIASLDRLVVQWVPKRTLRNWNCHLGDRHGYLITNFVLSLHFPIFVFGLLTCCRLLLASNGDMGIGGPVHVNGIVRHDVLVV